MRDNLLDEKRVGLIGAGNMAEAITMGLLKDGTLSADQIIASDVAEARRCHMVDTYGIKTTTDNIQVLQESDVVIIAVRPQVADAILTEVGPHARLDMLIISIMAGVTVHTLKGYFQEGIRLIRTIPNILVSVQEGMVALASDTTADESDHMVAEAIFKAIARTEIIDEKLMDAALAVSASGPAYAFLIAESIADGGVEMGLPKSVSLTLAAQTMLGSAKMCLESGIHPGRLKDMVITPGGTTITALHKLEEMGVRGALISAVEAAAKRAEEIGKLT